MENNKEMVTTTETVEEVKDTQEKVKTEETKAEKTYSRDELNKIIATEKSKLLQDIEAKRNEAEKLAKMKEDERLQYERDKAEQELNELKIQLNAKNLKDEAMKIATEKDLPIQYLDLIDFTKETAESISAKLQNIADARSKDLEGYLNSKLKEKAPFQKVEEKSTTKDPFLAGFEKGWNGR